MNAADRAAWRLIGSIEAIANYAALDNEEARNAIANKIEAFDGRWGCADAA